MEHDLYLVKCGASDDVYQLQGVARGLNRGMQVIVRTHRGLEFGTVLSSASLLGCKDLLAAKYVRRSQPEDRLLWGQLVSLSQDSAQACQQFLEDRGSEDVLLEVEPLLDGKTIFFHFLGDISASTEAYVEQLAEVYRQEIASSPFANRLETGCGPGCGTPAKSSCGTGSGCSTCSLSSGCAVRKPTRG
jgi:cell fate regulator YaaT (PSP1 superfamily)